MSIDRRRKAVILVLFSLIGLLPLSYVISTPAHGMTKFSSYWDLQHFLMANGCASSSLAGPAIRAAYGPQYGANYNLQTNTPGTTGTSTNALPQHSGTNNQVAGVDEPDKVKNDGHYIYLVTNNTLVILDAYPASNAKTLSRLHVNGTIQGIFIDGNNLAVLLGNDWSYPFLPVGVQATYPSWISSPASTILLFDSSDKSHPLLKTNMSINGTYVDARLIDHNIYLIATQRTSCSVMIPSATVNGQLTKVAPEQVYYSNLQYSGMAYTSIVSLNIANSSPPNVGTFLIGASSTIYASSKNIFLTMPSASGSNGQATVIHRISLNNGQVSYEATGTVPGGLLNQFSMDEYNGYLRVATSGSGFQTSRSFWWSGQNTNLYVLDKNLHVVGSLENLSSGEIFYSARFMGDRAYLVTYKQTDPLFVVDLRNPAGPIVLGKLTIDGYSDYLQAYDDNHLIGIGKMAAHTDAKISIFNVTDPARPAEVARYVVQGWSSESLASHDHKAVLLDPGMNLLVIPVEVYQAYQWIPATNSTSCTYYSTNPWEGAYVFNVTSNTLELRGTIVHQTSSSCTSIQPQITRELYIGNVLYTVSNAMVKMNSLEDLHELNSVNL